MQHIGFQKRIRQFVVTVLLAVVAVLPAQAQQDGSSTEPMEDRAVVAKFMPVYKPPLRGAPQVRVGGGTRGANVESTVVQVLAPDHPGLTLQAHPAFYWYVENPEADRLQFTLIDENAIDPLLEVDLDAAVKQGIQRLDLGDYDIELQPDVSYQWSVALVGDPAHRSMDVVSSAVIERRVPDAALNRRIEAGQGAKRVNLLAGAGIWYDALDTLSGLITKAPQDRQLQEMRTSLLDQVGLALPGHDR